MAAEPGSSHPATSLSPDLIFLSFAGADRARVEPIAAALRARGASVWYDAGFTAGGGNYVASVQRALRRAGAMLVFISASSGASPWVADEVRAYRSLMARERGRKLLAIHLDRTRAPLALAGVDSVDARDAQPEVTASLIASALANPALLPAQSPGATSPRMPAATSAASAAPASAAPASVAPAPQQPEVAQPRTGAAAPVATGQVFVSYARSDRDRVQRLAEALRARGVAVWDDSGLAHGSRGWVETARNALDRSQTLLVAVSAASVASPWVMDDVRAFQSLKTRDPGRALVAVHLDKTRAPLSLANAHVIDAQSLGPSDAASLIAGSLPAGAIQRAAAPTPPPPPPATPSAPMAPATEAAPVAVAGGPIMVEPSASDGATMPATAAPVEAAAVAQPPAAPPPPEPAAAEAPPAPAAEAPAPEAPAPEAPAPAPVLESPVAKAAPGASPEVAPVGMAETAPAPVVTPAAAAAARAMLAEKSAEAKGSGRAGEAVALLVVLLIAIAVAWALSFL